jgi:hypothetical protein
MILRKLLMHYGFCTGTGTFFSRRKPAKTIFDIFDPFDLEQGHYTDQDQEIRNTDIPERMQLRQVITK